MAPFLQASQQIVQQMHLQRSICIVPWLLWGLSIALTTSSVGLWISFWSETREPMKESADPEPDNAFVFSEISDRMTLSQPQLILPWFGTVELPSDLLKPPTDAIEVSQRDLHLIGISTSTSPGESFALIRIGSGEIKSLKTGDAPEQGVELVDLLPNTALLKAGDQWEKLHIGDPPSHGNSHTTMDVSRRGGGVDRMTLVATVPTSSIASRRDSQPRRSVNPNLTNRDIRERMDALMATLQQ